MLKGKLLANGHEENLTNFLQDDVHIAGSRVKSLIGNIDELLNAH